MSEDTQEYTADPISTNESDEWVKFLSKVLDTTTTENGNTDLRKVEEAVRLVNSIIDNVERMCTSGIISTNDAQTMVKQMLDPETIADPSTHTPSNVVEEVNGTGSFLIEFSHADREFIDAIWCFEYSPEEVNKGVFLRKKYLKYKILLMLYQLSCHKPIRGKMNRIPNDSVSIPNGEVPLEWFCYLNDNIGANVHFKYSD